MSSAEVFLQRVVAHADDSLDPDGGQNTSGDAGDSSLPPPPAQKRRSGRGSLGGGLPPLGAAAQQQPQQQPQQPQNNHGMQQHQQQGHRGVGFMQDGSGGSGPWHCQLASPRSVAPTSSAPGGPQQAASSNNSGGGSRSAVSGGGAATTGGSIAGNGAGSAVPSPVLPHLGTHDAAPQAQGCSDMGPSPFASAQLQQHAQALSEQEHHAQQQQQAQQQRAHRLLHGADAGVGGFGSVQMLPLSSRGFGSNLLVQQSLQVQAQQAQQQRNGAATAVMYGPMQDLGVNYGGSLGFGVGLHGGASLQLSGGVPGGFGSIQLSNLQLNSSGMALSGHQQQQLQQQMLQQMGSAFGGSGAMQAHSQSSLGQQQSQRPLQDMHSFTQPQAAQAAAASAAAQAGLLSALQLFPHAALHAGSGGMQQLLGSGSQGGSGAYGQQQHAAAYSNQFQQQGCLPQADTGAETYHPMQQQWGPPAYPSHPGTSQPVHSSSGGFSAVPMGNGGSMGGLTITTGEPSV